MSDYVRPLRRQPTRLRHPWDSPGKNTGVGCHFLLQCMKVKSESEDAQLCLTLSPPGSSVHGVFQARVLEWVAIAFSRDGLVQCKFNSRELSSECAPGATEPVVLEWNSGMPFTKPYFLSNLKSQEILATTDFFPLLFRRVSMSLS